MPSCCSPPNVPELGTSSPISSSLDFTLQDLVVLAGLYELLDVEYYRDLEIKVRDHSRSFKLVPFESLGMVSYLQFM